MMNFIVFSMMGFSPTPTKTNINSFKYMGSVLPVKDFDPLKISTPENVKYLREAELMHGRVAMMSSVIIPTIEALKLNDLGIDYLSKMDLNSQLPFWYLMALAEFYRMKNGWTNPFGGENSTKFGLADDYQPGNLLNYKVDDISDRAYDSELNNGRLAMLAVTYMLAKELFLQTPIVSF